MPPPRASSRLRSRRPLQSDGGAQSRELPAAAAELAVAPWSHVFAQMAGPAPAAVAVSATRCPRSFPMQRASLRSALSASGTW
eukprot:4948468-Pleurochrysis_carterae.AAC.1